MGPMYDAQDEIERLKQEVEGLQKQIATQQSVANLPQSLIENHDFITDLARYAEGLYSEQDIKKKYHFDDATWVRLGEDDALVEAIEAEKVRRVRNGQAKREKAQQLVVQACDVLGEIMRDADASPKHRIDASKALDAFADNGPQMAPAADRFVITINLGADQQLKIDKSIKPIANDKDIEVIDTTPQELLPIFATNRKDDGGGNPI